MTRRFGLVLALGACLVLTWACSTTPKKVSPTQTWGDVNRDESLEVFLPKDGVITNRREFVRLWRLVRRNEPVPPVNFRWEFVYVTWTNAPHNLTVNATLERRALTAVATPTSNGGKGFGYVFAAFPRRGITTVNGQALRKG